jgi:glucosamine-phosphate N-acetyltransferase
MGFFIRHLLPTDYTPEYFELIGQLTVAPVLTQTQFENFVSSLGPLHQVYIILDLSSNKIVGSGSIFIEPKLTHGYSQVAHIEDIVTDQSVRSQGLGQMLINHLVQIACDSKCYKVILDCGEHNIGFYSKCGFKLKGVQMAKYF